MTIADELRSKAYSYLVDNDALCRNVHHSMYSLTKIGVFEFSVLRTFVEADSLGRLLHFLSAGGFTYHVDEHRVSINWSGTSYIAATA